MTKPARINQADIERAIRAARKAAPDSRVVIDLVQKRIAIELSPAADSVDDNRNGNPLDRLLDGA